MLRKYLSVFLMRQAGDASTAQYIKYYVERVSNGDAKVAFVTDSSVGYLFTSATVPSEFDWNIESSVQVLTVEVGNHFSQQGLPNPGQWLWDRRDR